MREVLPLVSTAYAASELVPGIRSTCRIQLLPLPDNVAAVHAAPLSESQTFETATLSLHLPLTVNSSLLHFVPVLMGFVMVNNGLAMSLKFATKSKFDAMTNFKVAPLVMKPPKPSVQLSKAKPVAALAVME